MSRRPSGNATVILPPPRRDSLDNRLTAGRCRLAAAGAALAALTAIPPAALAQTCTPAGYTGTLPAVTYDGPTATIACTTLTGGLEMTLGAGLTIGTEASPVEDRGVYVGGQDAGDKDIAVMGGGTIYADHSGFFLERDGTGLLKLEFTKGKIVSGGSSAGFGIRLKHSGEAGKEAIGIRIVSGADIDLSAHTSNGKRGIHATTTTADPTAVIPIEIRVTGGTIDVSDPSGSSPTAGGAAVKAEQFAKGDIAVTAEKAAMLGTKEAVAGAYGIEARVRAGGEGDITITHRGGIHAGTGIFAHSDSTSAEKGDITVTTDPGSMIAAKKFKEYDYIYEEGISATIAQAASAGDITIAHKGTIEAGGTGIRVSNDGKGDVTVTTGKDSKLIGGDDEHGIFVTTGSENEGNLTITHDGSIEADRSGIYAYNDGTGSVTVTTGAGSRIIARGEEENDSGIRAGPWGAASAADVTITHGGEITAKSTGINAFNRVASAGGTGAIRVTTAEGSKITAEKQGILVRHEGTGAFDVAVRGMVTGDSAHTGGSDTKYAGVHVWVEEDDITAGGGGTIAVGSRAHVHALSGDAVRADGHAGPVKIILELDKDGLTGHLEGRILNPEEERKKDSDTTTAQAELTFHTRAGTDDDAPLTRLTADDAVKGIVHRRKVSDGISDEVIKAQLQTTLAENGKPAWYEFIDLPAVQRLYRDRARLYETLPSVLLDLNARPGSGTGMCEGGARAEVSMSEGERMAESSTTAAGWKKRALGWDMKRRVVEAGYDFPADGSLCVGFRAGRRTVKADVMRGGGIKAEATGGAVTLGWRPDSGVDVSWRLSYSRLHDIELSPAGGGAVIAAPGGGGVSVSVAAGKRMEFQGMQVTPRAGFEFSSVETGGFTEPAALDGAGEVSDVRAGSLKGTVGARIDMAAGEAGTLWAAADVEHDFKGGTDITVTGAVLEAEMKPTWGRLGLGGEFRLSDMITVSGGAHYAAGGGGNKDLGGSLALNVSF